MSSAIFPLQRLPLASRTLRRVTGRASSVQRAESGKTFVIRRQLSPLRRWAMDFGGMSEAAGEVAELARFAAIHGGRADTFLLRDPADYQVADHGFGIGDGVTAAFQLQRSMAGSVSDVLGSYAFTSKRRTNLLTRSTEFQTSWGYENVTVSPNVAVAPDGTVTADKLVESATTGVHRLSRSTGGGALLNANYTASVFGKAGERRYFGMKGMPNSPVFDLQAGAVVAGSGATIAGVGGGWWRCIATGIPTPVGSYINYWTLLTGPTFTGESYAGDGTSGLYLWGGQLELGSVATRPIPTAASAASADPAYWPALGDGFEPVTEPAPGIVVTKDGVDLVQGTGWTLGANGLVTPTVLPAAGAQLAWSGSFYRRVRFASDDLELERIAANVWRSGRVELEEVKP